MTIIKTELQVLEDRRIRDQMILQQEGTLENLITDQAPKEAQCLEQDQAREPILIPNLEMKEGQSLWLHPEILEQNVVAHLKSLRIRDREIPEEIKKGLEIINNKT